MSSRAVVTRFAPSPTGFMHVGSVRTALYAWLYARKHNGTFLLRIEDTDKEREVEGSIPHIIESLTWLGLEWDEGIEKGGPHMPYVQSERLETYRSYAETLIKGGYAYADPYSEEELEELRKRAEVEKQPFLFRDHRPDTPEPWQTGKPLRFRAPTIKRYAWIDLVRGPLSAGEEAVDDFILIKSDGYPTYNFAHIVDDIEMGVTHVMRGEEFISSTPKFLSLYEALGKTPPAFATMPVILHPDGKKKLSKRDGAKDLLEYRTEGYLPEAFVNYLALLGWNPGTEQEFFSPKELVEAFELERIQKSGARFDEVKLLYINQHWMRLLSDEAFMAQGNFNTPDPAQLKKIIPLLKDRAKTFTEARDLLTGELACFFVEPTFEKSVLVTKEPNGNSEATKTHLSHILEVLTPLPETPSVDEVKTILMPYADSLSKEQGGRGAALWPLRYALSGQERSPDPFTLISILGMKKVVERVQKALAILEK